MKRRAFTLIELLVVIAIIALLMAILLPSLSIVKERARMIVCSSNLKTLSTAWFAYQADNNGKLVGADTYSGPADWIGLPEDEDGNLISAEPYGTIEEEQRGIKKGKLWPYAKDLGAYHCSSDKRSKENPTGAFRSYSIQNNMNGSPWAPQYEDIVQRFTQIKRPSAKFVILENTDDRGFNINSWYFQPRSDARNWNDALAIWHGKYSCFGFADGHADRHKWTEESTFVMAEDQTNGQQLFEGEEGVDLEWARKAAGPTF